MLLTPAEIKPKSFESRQTLSSVLVLFLLFLLLFFVVFTLRGHASYIRASLDAMLLQQSYQYPNLSEGADRVLGYAAPRR